MERLATLLRNRQRQKARVWKAFEFTGDEETFKKDIAAVEKDIQQYQVEKDNLEKAYRPLSSWC
jgi:hypothetical protein